MKAADREVAFAPGQDISPDEFQQIQTMVRRMTAVADLIATFADKKQAFDILVTLPQYYCCTYELDYTKYLNTMIDTNKDLIGLGKAEEAIKTGAVKGGSN